jgi:hypothetical protein
LEEWTYWCVAEMLNPRLRSGQRCSSEFWCVIDDETLDELCFLLLPLEEEEEEAEPFPIVELGRESIGSRKNKPPA